MSLAWRRAEVRVRAQQAVSAWAERAWSARKVEPRPKSVFADGDRASGARLLESFRSRNTPQLSPAFADRARTASELRRRFGDTIGPALTAHADQIVEERFDLLGFRGLSFGSPIDWHLDPVSGLRLPLVHWSRLVRLDPGSAVDRKVIWELNRHHSLVVLGRAYWLTDDDRYAEAFAKQLNAWLDENPPGLGVNWSSSLELALRSIAWTWALTLFRDSPWLAPDLFMRALTALWYQARHVATYPSTYTSPNTHLTGEGLGLFYVGTLWPELQGAAAWGEAGLKILLAELERQVTADGVYFERSTAYHLYTADFYTHLVVLAAANGEALPERVRDRLAALLDHLLYISRPDGTIPLLGDDDGGRLLPLDERTYCDTRPTLALGAALLGRADYKTIGASASDEMLWLLGPESLSVFDRLEPRPPGPTSRAFRSGGVYVMRDGWSEGSSVLAIDCGDHGGGHDHAGALGFDLTFSGRPVLVDPGTHSYLRGGARGDYFRSTAAHNAVVVDGRSSSVPAGPFGWKLSARATLRAWCTHPHYDYFEGSHDGYRRLSDPVTHIRSILYVRGAFWVIRDRLIAAGAHRYCIRFHFPPEAEAHLAGARGDPALGDPPFQIVTFGPGSWRLATEQVSRCYGASDPAPVAEFTSNATDPQELITFLLPGRSATVQEVAAVGGRAFEIRNGDSRDVFATHEQGLVKVGEVFVHTSEQIGCGLARGSDGAWLVERLESACAE
jgi:Heparinase II/III-like protein/Heparinase II/III N-terminus